MKEKDYITEVEAAINNSEIHVVVQTAPAVRAGLGEEFGLPIEQMSKVKWLQL